MNIKRGRNDNGLGFIEFITQDDTDEQFRLAITPRKGQWLEVEDLDNRRFRITVRHDGDELGEEDETPQARLLGMTKQDLLDLAARKGVEVKPDMLKADLIVKLREAGAGE